LRQKRFKYESSRIRKKTLRELQNHPAQGRHSGDLQQQTAQAAARMIAAAMI
jgi:replication fork clamp-binding protein CrfC